MTLDVRSLTDEELDALIKAEAHRLAYFQLPDNQIEDTVIQKTADLVESLTRMQHDHPLAFATLWERPDAVADQRRAVAALRGLMILLILGGNRSGKSFAAKELTVAMALGGDHPAVIAWLTDNGLPMDLIPDGPAEVFAVAQSGTDSVRYHREDVDALLPPEDTTWRNRRVPVEACAEIEVPGYAQPARIWFKSIDQKARSFRGKEVRFVWIDEEPEGDGGEEVFEECLRAISSKGGQLCMSFTPHNGFTWVYERLVVGAEFGAQVIELDSFHNSMVDDPAGVRTWLNSLSEDQQMMRRFGKFTDLRGMVYAQFSRGDGDRWGPGNLCDDFEIPEEWPRFIGVDWGIKDPTAVVWAAVGDDGTIYIYRVHKQAGPSFREHARIAHELMGNRLGGTGQVIEIVEPLELGWADSASPKAIDAWAEAEIYLELANKEVKFGIDAVKDMVRLWPDARPRLKIFRSCPELVAEVETYRWDSRVKIPKPVKKNDHLLDALRYLIVGIKEWLM